MKGKMIQYHSAERVVDALAASIYSSNAVSGLISRPQHYRYASGKTSFANEC
jgi:hypothetical protein